MPIVKTFSKSAAFVSAIVLLALAGCSGEDKYPPSIDLAARPGSVAVVPFDQRVEGAPKRALSYVPARAWIDPDPLPQGARVLQINLNLFGSGDVSGSILVFVPPEARGDVAFSVSASGDGRGQSASIVPFKTDSVDVTLAVDGEPLTEDPPSLVGDWHDEGGDIWRFSGPPSQVLTKVYASGEEKVEHYDIYPDGAGRWFLVCVNPKDGAYWIDVGEDGVLSVDRSGGEFEPFATLTRAPAD